MRMRTLSFVQYQPHANPTIRKLNPALYFVRLFMNMLLWGTLSFFTLHTLSVVHSREEGAGQARAGSGGET
jgi:hypothetical protein